MALSDDQKKLMDQWGGICHNKARWGEKLGEFVHQVTMTEGCAYVQLEDDDGDAASSTQNYMIVTPSSQEPLPYDFSYDVRSIVIYQKTYLTSPLEGLCPNGYKARLGAGTVLEARVAWDEAERRCNENASCCGIMQSMSAEWRFYRQGKLDLVKCDIRESSTWTATCVKEKLEEQVCDTIAFGEPAPPDFVTTGSFVQFGPGLCVSNKSQELKNTKADKCSQKCWLMEDCKGYSTQSTNICHLWLDPITDYGQKGSTKSARCFKKNLDRYSHPWRFANWGAPTSRVTKDKAPGVVEGLVSSILKEDQTEGDVVKLLTSYATELASSATDLLNILTERTTKQIELLAVHSLAQKYGAEEPSKWGEALTNRLNTSSCVQQRKANGCPPAQIPGTCSNYKDFEFYEKWYKELPAKLQEDLLRLGFLSRARGEIYSKDLEGQNTAPASEACFQSTDLVVEEQSLLLANVQEQLMGDPARRKKMYIHILNSPDFPDMCQWVAFLKLSGGGKQGGRGSGSKLELEWQPGSESISALANLIGTKSSLTLATLYASNELGFDAQAAFMDLGSLLQVMMVFQYNSGNKGWPSLDYGGQNIPVDKVATDVVAKMTLATFIQQLTVSASSLEIKDVTSTAEDVDELTRVAMQTYNNQTWGKERDACKEEMGLCQFLLDLLNDYVGERTGSLLQSQSDEEQMGPWRARKTSLVASAGYLLLKVSYASDLVYKCHNKEILKKENKDSGCKELSDVKNWAQYSEEVPMAMLDFYDQAKGVKGFRNLIDDIDEIKTIQKGMKLEAMKLKLVSKYTETLASMTKRKSSEVTVDIVAGSNTYKGVTKFRANNNELLAWVGEKNDWLKVTEIQGAQKTSRTSLMKQVSRFKKWMGPAGVKIASTSAAIGLQYFCLGGVISDLKTMLDAFENEEIWKGVWAMTSMLGGVVGLLNAAAQAAIWTGVSFAGKLGVALVGLAGPAGAVISMVLAAIGGIALLILDVLDQPATQTQLQNELCCYAARLGFPKKILNSDVKELWDTSTPATQCEEELISENTRMGGLPGDPGCLRKAHGYKGRQCQVSKPRG
jgi:hypothetical protein